MPFHHETDEALTLIGRLGEELLRRGVNRLEIRLHFDLRHRFDGHRDALFGVEVLHRRHVERHQLERELTDGFDHRKDHRAVAFHDARAAKPVDDERFVRSCLAIERGEKGAQQRHDEHHQADDHPEAHADRPDLHICLL